MFSFSVIYTELVLVVVPGVALLFYIINVIGKIWVNVKSFNNHL